MSRILKFLVVDDSKTMRSVVKRCLEQAGYGKNTIIEAGDANEALRMIQAQKPDVVLTDLYMPGLTGMDLLAELKERGIKVNVGFITSETHPSLAEQALSEGAKFVLTKPPAAPALKKALDKIVGGLFD